MIPQGEILKPHPVKPLDPTGSDDSNIAIPKVSFDKPPDAVQRDTTNLRRSSRVIKPDKKYTGIVSIIKNSFHIFGL